MMSDVLRGRKKSEAHRKNIGIGARKRKRPVRRRTARSAVDRRIGDSKGGASRRGLEWNLSQTEARNLVIGPCHYCGLSSNVDNNRGYLSGNCVSCCAMCNKGKSAYVVEKFLDWVERVYRHQEKATLLSNT